MSLYLQELPDGSLRIVFDDRRGSGYAQWDRAGVLIEHQCDMAPPSERELPDRPCSTCGNAAEQQPSTPTKPSVLKGIIGLTKAHAGVDKADDDTVSKRQRICEKCKLNDLGRCRECGCYLWAKVRVAGERCRVGKW